MKKVLHTFTEKQFAILTAAAAVLLSVIMIMLNVGMYQRYRRNLIEAEKKELLTMARTTGTSLQQHMQKEMEWIDLCLDISEDVEKVSGQIVRHSNGMYEGCIGIRKGEIFFSFGETTDDPFKYVEKTDETASIVGKELNPSGWYEVLIGKKLSSEDSCTILFSMNLKEVYDHIVAPVRIGEGGYSVVKDSDLAIIMHHAKNQIGMDALYDREEAYPQLDLTSLKKWLDLQRRQEEGTGILDSYVWDDPALTPVQRIVAYVTIDLGREKWIVNSTLPLTELGSPLKSMVSSMAILGTVYLLAILLVCAAFMRAMGRSIRQRREIEYLREINRGMNLVARKNEEIRHYQRIQSMGMMSSHIAHEFNNYLTPVMLYGEMLEGDETISEDNREMLREMLKSVDQAAKLSRDLLDFSRMDTGGKQKPINLSEEAEEAVSIVRRLVPAKITLHEDISEQPAWLTCREGILQHTLMNLSKNAFHAMEETEKKELTIRYEVLGKDSKAMQAVLTVQDTGCGIRKEDMENIFEPFYTTKGSRQGTGLGLSVVRSLVENAGGSIEVRSNRGEGTSFVMTFPVTPEPPAQQVPTTEQAAIVCICRSRKSLEPWRAYLESLPGSIVYVFHEASFVARLQEQPDLCDLLLIEETLTGMRGIELAQIVRRQNPKIRILLLTGEDTSNLQWYLDNGVIDGIRER